MEKRITQNLAWSLTPEAFSKFLACLDGDAEKAGEKYESVRLLLIKFFDWRGAFNPEDCADETINRVIRKIDEGESIRDIPTFCYGVARLFFLETLRHPESKRADFEEINLLDLIAPNQEDNSDPRQECFDRCLQRLPSESRDLITHYYRDEKRSKINNRLALAEKLGIPLNALRNRAQRIRDKIESCIDDCLKKV